MLYKRSTKASLPHNEDAVITEKLPVEFSNHLNMNKPDVMLIFIFKRE